VRDNLQDDRFIAEHTTGFEAVKRSVESYDPRTVAEMTGVPPESIEKAARIFARADRSIAMHARGLEHQSKGVENCSALINLTLATGHVGREGCGCTMITGQGNGQGGRDHGQMRSVAGPAIAARSRCAAACRRCLGNFA
jgi:assimilatory nitrate reductase catalytic subunit